jgi:hypothetical protein
MDTEGCLEGAGSIHPIRTLEGRFGDLFKLIIGIRSPAVNAIESARRAHQAIHFYMDRLQKCPRKEIEEFMDSLTNLAKNEVSSDDVLKFKKKMDGLGLIGKTLRTFQRNFEKLDRAEKKMLSLEAVGFTADKTLELSKLIGEEIYERPDDRTFSHLLMSQACFYKASVVIADSARIIKDEGDLSEREGWRFFLAIYAIIRVEAMRRGKISLDDLRDTYTDLIAVSLTSPVLTFGQPPDEMWPSLSGVSI